MQNIHKPHNRLIAALLVLVCLLGLLPTTAMAATPDTIKMDDCAYNGVKYDSPALGECYMHQMHFGLNGKRTMGFCAEIMIPNPHTLWWQCWSSHFLG